MGPQPFKSVCLRHVQILSISTANTENKSRVILKEAMKWNNT